MSEVSSLWPLPWHEAWLRCGTKDQCCAREEAIQQKSEHEAKAPQRIGIYIGDSVADLRFESAQDQWLKKRSLLETKIAAIEVVLRQDFEELLEKGDLILKGVVFPNGRELVEIGNEVRKNLYIDSADNACTGSGQKKVIHFVSVCADLREPIDGPLPPGIFPLGNGKLGASKAQAAAYCFLLKHPDLKVKTRHFLARKCRDSIFKADGEKYSIRALIDAFNDQLDRKTKTTSKMLMRRKPTVKP